MSEALYRVCSDCGAIYSLSTPIDICMECSGELHVDTVNLEGGDEE